MLGYLAGLLILAILLSYFFKKELVYTIPMVMLSTIILLYFFGIFGALKAGVYTLYAIAFAAFIIFVIISVKRRSIFLKDISLVPVVIITVFSLLSLWMHNGRLISLWDEFSHWGRAVKDMYYLDSLAGHPDSMVIFKTYPPGVALLQYLFVNIRGSYVEAELFHGINIIYFSLVMPFFKSLEGKDWFRIIIIMLITIIMPTGFYTMMHETLYVDGLLGAIFAYILFTYFTNKPDKFTFINISAALFVLSITKESGAGLAFLCLFIMFADIVIANRKQVKEYLNSSNIIAEASCLLLPVIFTIAAKLSWSAYLAHHGIGLSSGAAKITLGGIIDIFAKGNSTAVQSQIMINFLKATTNVTNGYANFVFNASPMTLVTVFLFLCAIMVYMHEEREKKKKIITAGFSILFSCAMYMFTLLCAYLFLFTEYEALGLASFTRYLSTFFLGVYMLIVGCILRISRNEKIEKRKMPKYLLIFFIIFCITGLQPLFNATVISPASVGNTISSRCPYECIEEMSCELCEDDEVYFIDVGSNGLIAYLSSYLAFPSKVSGIGSIGTHSYYEGDIWTAIISPERLQDILIEGFDYLYLYETGYDFGEVYGQLFGGEEYVSAHTLYKVNKMGDGPLLIADEG